MKIFTASILIASCALINSLATAQEKASWGYKRNKPATSPEQWAEYYPTCGGSRQSPINIEATTGGDFITRLLSFRERTCTIKFLPGSCGAFNLTQNDKSFKCVVVGGSCFASAGGASYSLSQFHFHSQSEHTLTGQALDDEAHFVHSNGDGSALLVVGPFFQAGDYETDSWIAPVLDGMDAVTPEKWQSLNFGSYADLVNTKAYADRVLQLP
ncbi:hypothetical protein DVH05_010426 [Phytophthora capsici]|nr:hypothetical protein DVH05_010426 [Phytophthora capsici]